MSLVFAGSDKDKCEGAEVKLPKVNIEKELSAVVESLNTSINPSDLKKLCIALDSLNTKKVSIAEYRELINNILEFKVSPTDPTYKQEFEKLWNERKKDLTCSSDVLDINTGSNKLMEVAFLALRNYKINFLTVLLTFEKINLNTWIKEDLSGVKETPLDFLDSTIKDIEREADKKEFEDLKKFFIQRGAKYCKEIKECSEA